MFVVWSNLHDQEVGIFGIVFQNIDNTRELLDVWWILELEVLGAFYLWFCFESIFFIIWTELQFDLNQRDYLNWEVIVLFSYWETTAFVYNIENG